MERPDARDLRRIARASSVPLPEEDLEATLGLLDRALRSFDRVEELAAAAPSSPPARDSGRPPTETENPLGAWLWRCSLTGSPDGPLAGRSVAVKDNVAVAGMPMTDGSSLLEGFMASADATIVTRILRAGGKIAGKAACEALCLSGGSHTSSPRPVRNPRAPDHMAGGSSSGSAALVAAGAVELAVGGDQAGSIRIPASWCDVVGLKPTYGLVPYTGILPLDPTIDHAGPIGPTVSEVALLLDAMAGRDGLDPRQLDVPADLPPISPLEVASTPSIGVLEEGFGWPDASEPEVDEAVRAALELARKAGATVRAVSVPPHRDGVHVWTAVATGGVWACLVRDRLAGHGVAGPREPLLAAALDRAARDRPAELPPGVRMTALLGAHLAERHLGRHYALGQALRTGLREAYDRALTGFDALALPTTPWGPPLLDEELTQAELVRRTVGPIENTCPFDLTGHPAISLPCGSARGLPVGLMLVGRRLDEATLLSVAAFVERTLAASRGPGLR